MPEQDLQEMWQVEVGGQVYEAAFGELPDWIAEGSLLPEDKVRKGNLRWIEARKVPKLLPFFDAKQKGLPMPKMSTPAAVSAPDTPPASEIAAGAVSYAIPASPVEAVIAQEIPEYKPRAADPNSCSVHPDAPTAYRCVDCEGSFCKPCPKSFGGTVKICPSCGGMCKSIGELQKAAEKIEFRASALAEGFGFSDFVNAFKHPFKFKASLIIGAVMFMFFTLGQSAGAMGGMMMAASGIISIMFANMLLFGVLSNTVDAFAHGHLDSNFMPEFEDFSLLDDVVKPFFLSIGVYISSFGPFILTLIVGFYLLMSAVTSTTKSIQTDLEKIPGTNYYSASNTVEQSERVRSVVGDMDRDAEDRIDDEEAIENGETGIATTSSEMSEEEINDLMKMAQEGRKAQLESVVGKTPETRDQEQQAMVRSFLSLAPPLVVIGAICFLWGLFYFPAACAVAGYTRSFAATVNPTVGLDTIKRLGVSYVKVLLMYFALIFISGFVGGILGVILSPFDLPGLGNLAAAAVGSLLNFYFSAVFACVLGYALFKASDRLNLS
jgi:hypothetical protein